MLHKECKFWGTNMWFTWVFENEQSNLYSFYPTQYNWIHYICSRWCFGWSASSYAWRSEAFVWICTSWWCEKVDGEYCGIFCSISHTVTHTHSKNITSVQEICHSSTFFFVPFCSTPAFFKLFCISLLMIFMFMFPPGFVFETHFTCMTHSFFLLCLVMWYISGSYCLPKVLFHLTFKIILKKLTPLIMFS